MRWASSVADAKWQKLPPAAYLPDDTAPTALSWLRRRLPGVPDSVLHRLFRKRDVKMLTALGLRINARPDTQLPAGGVLAIPLSVQAKEHTARSLTPGTLGCRMHVHCRVHDLCGAQTTGALQVKLWTRR